MQTAKSVLVSPELIKIFANWVGQHRLLVVYGDDSTNFCRFPTVRQLLYSSGSVAGIRERSVSLPLSIERLRIVTPGPFLSTSQGLDSQECSSRDSVVRSISTVGLVGVIAFLVSVMWASYNGGTITETFSFRVVDGWCDPATEGIGFHCFSDFGQAQNAVFDESTYRSLNAGNTPLTLVVFAIFRLLPYRPSLILYLLTLVAAPIMTIWIASRGLQWIVRISCITFGAILNVGLISALDRGNHVIWMTPILYWYLVSIHRGRTDQTILALSLLSSLKWWGFWFFLPLLIQRKWREISMSAAITVGINHVAFGFYPGSYISKLSETAKVVFDREYGAEVAKYSINLTSVFTRFICLARGDNYCDFSSSWANGTVATYGKISILLILLSVLYWIGVRIQPSSQDFLSLVPLIGILALPEAGMYNIALVTSGLALLITRRSNELTTDLEKPDRPKLSRKLTILMMAIQLPVGLMITRQTPLSGLSSDGYTLRLQYLSVPLLSMACCFVAIQAAYRIRTKLGNE